MNVIQQQVYICLIPCPKKWKWFFADEAHDYVESMASVYSTHQTCLYISVNFFPSNNFLLGFQVLASGLRNLEELYLSSNKLNDNILSSLSGFSTLKSLDLSGNMFTGSTGLNGKVVNHFYLGWHSLMRFNN
jgi:hypothetical protein